MLLDSFSLFMQWDYGKFILKQLDYSPSFSTRDSQLKRPQPKRQLRKLIYQRATPRAMYNFLELQETPFLSSITENLENTSVDQPADDSQSIIRDIQIENERLTT